MKIQWVGVQGRLSSSISDSDVTISSAGLVDLPEIVAPDYAKITLDPNGDSGRPEVVFVTDHVANATTATVTRGEEQIDGGSVARSHASNTRWMHAPTPEDYEGMIVAADQTERESLTVTDGSVVWQQDTAEHWTYVDGATPVWQRNNLSVGTTAGTVAAGDDSRFVTVPAEMLGVFSGGGEFETVGVPGQGFVTTSTGTLTAGRDYYFQFVVRKALTITFAQIQVTTGPASDATIYVGIYAATNAGQPTGSPLLNTTISCTSGATGIKSVSSLAVALPAGNYVSVINTSVSFGIRTFGSAVGTGFSASLGTGPGNGYVFGTRTAAAFTSSPTAWNNTNFNGGMSMGVNSLFFKWTTP